MNNSHASFLIPFFKKMNLEFADKWCVLHSYETLPYYSASDVDMAFSGKDIFALENLIKRLAKQTGWVLLQKLWYDVQNCYYYVLRHDESDTLLAIDFLMDNDGIGKYGFTTKSLTKNCVLIKDCFPVPNAETAFCYKLVKRIVKKRSIQEDESYLASQYDVADKAKVNTILTHQFGKKGKEPILTYLTDKNKTLAVKDIILLNKIRQREISSIGNRFKYLFWEIKRTLNRVLFPSGMLISIPNMDKEKLVIFTNTLEKKVGILFRFVRLNETNSKMVNLKGFVGSTLIICPNRNLKSEITIKSTWRSGNSVKFNTGSGKYNAEEWANHCFIAIIEALEARMQNKFPDGK